jgi:hypothetical protein
MFINLSYKSNLEKRKSHFEISIIFHVCLFDFQNNNKKFNLHFYFFQVHVL